MKKRRTFPNGSIPGSPEKAIALISVFVISIAFPQPFPRDRNIILSETRYCSACARKMLFLHLTLENDAFCFDGI